MNDKRCVLAYSGGLDTSAIVIWLREKGYEVHAVLVDVGQNEDLAALCLKAKRLGAASTVIRDATPAMLESVVPMSVGLAATYEGNYRLGTAIARPFIAAEQVRRAKELGGATLAHGATGKGNDQIRFEFGYRSLAPGYPVLAPWKVWDLEGRRDLVEYLLSRGYNENFSVTKELSMDENLWHLSVEGGDLEDPAACVDIEKTLAAVSDRFAVGGSNGTMPRSVDVAFSQGVPTALNGEAMALGDLLGELNRTYRHASWAWDLVIENRFTGIKSRGVYINPAAKLLHLAVDGLARCCLNKPTYEQYVELGRQYGAMLYRGEYFSDQRQVLEAVGRAIMGRLGGTVTVQLEPVPYVSCIQAPRAIFAKSLSTFEASAYRHADAAGFINLSWLSSVGRPFAEEGHGDVVEAKDAPASDVRPAQPVPGAGLVPAAV